MTASSDATTFSRYWFATPASTGSDTGTNDIRCSRGSRHEHVDRMPAELVLSLRRGIDRGGEVRSECIDAGLEVGDPRLGGGDPALEVERAPVAGSARFAMACARRSVSTALLTLE